MSGCSPITFPEPVGKGWLRQAEVDPGLADQTRA
jgi:hypothetical protein